MRQKKQDQYIEKKLEEAKGAIQQGLCFFHTESNDFVNEFIALNIGHTEEICPLLSELLSELRPEYYIKSDIKDAFLSALQCELFTFIWQSDKLKKKAKLIFALNTGHFYYLSLS